MYAEILINHAFSKAQETLTYEVPEGQNVQIGSGVWVPFRQSKKAGLVMSLTPRKPEFTTRPIEGVLETDALLSPWQFALAEWISEYYFCSKIDVVKLMLPKHIWRVPKTARKSKKTVEARGEDFWHTLTPEQESIVNSIIEEQAPVSLIQGVTGSGKTEIYKHLIRSALQKSKQALLLVPEIALTPQLLKSFEGGFLNIGVIHSRVSEGKKAELWRGIRSGEIQLVIGSRSAIFAPFKNLGITILDEEHEWSYKQDQTPRYHARDVAIKMGELTGAPVILGSATPSLESRYQAEQKNYSFYELKDRAQGTALPEVQIVDMREELKGGNFTMFSGLLEDKIRATLDAGSQVILFLNRRGSASSTVCRDCGLAMECPHCDTKLTHHAKTFKNPSLICHHCGFIQNVPTVCPNCESPRIRHFGLGTEKVERELQALFPTARIARADKDTTSQKDSFKDLHKKMMAHEIDILVGTQMIAKGWDIPKLMLTGVVLADMGLHIPDFRASERSFQLLTQVGGRAGRRKERGEVIIQTYTPTHPALLCSQTHDYNQFYEQEIYTRKVHDYPPFSKFIKLIYVSSTAEEGRKASQVLQDALKDGAHTVNIAPALLPRFNKKYYWHVFIKGPDPRSLLKTLPVELLKQWRIDVDPVHTV